jgi:voltage-gated potassium channel
MSLRSLLFRQLAPEGWHARGMSPTNKFLSLLIVLGGLFAIVATEDTIVGQYPRMFRWAELTFAVAFTIEYVARVYAAGERSKYRGFTGRLKYMLSPAALLDIAATIPLYVAFLPSDAALLRLVRLLGILRFAKLGRYSRAMRYVSEAVLSRRFELVLSLATGGAVLLLTSTLLYLAEGAVQPEKFGSIPRALWWSVSTLTTVGYGDVYPITPLGKVLAGCTAIIGVGLIAMPTGILSAAFSEVFQRHRLAAPPRDEADTISNG